MNTIRTQESFVTRYTHEALNSERTRENVKDRIICTKKDAPTKTWCTLLMILVVTAIIFHKILFGNHGL